MAVRRSDAAGGGDARAWLEGLSADELRGLLADAVVQVDGMAEFVARRHIAATDDLGSLADEVEDTFTPTCSFYEYRAANEYAREAEPVVRLLEQQAEQSASLDFLTILQRAIDQAVRTIVRSDDSSGMQGDQIQRLLDLHAKVAARLSLPTNDVKKLVKWLFTFRFGGKQDFFEIDIDRYGTVLGEVGVQEYRRLLDEAAAKDPDDFAVRHARRRLAVLSGDADQIIAQYGSDLSYARQYIDLVEALEAAGLRELAVEYARRGMKADPASQYVRRLVDRVVDDARRRKSYDEVVQARRDHFQAAPSSSTYAALRDEARKAGVWEKEQEAAGALLAGSRPWEWVYVLHKDGDDEAAWRAAEQHADVIGDDTWLSLCERRVKSDPASTLPHYRRIIESTLTAADRRNYRAAVRVLEKMRVAAEAKGAPDEFADYLADVAERNRRRPSFLDELRRAGMEP
ncbi:hypothetical protein [Phytoactinopolyspora halotolerans]|uniref:Uncharacterized protein n=1 Tax=Phytoactinopolyspora halotolerans TaxID=1981512 RepID=A0A6L9SF91_9ACTN|nr:hypothetical protein [Phytoactinopolyspora halotolerans]NEE03769.1 hypothetical protein [Phytoactinopolyspora halotolerans]